jgi:hypothetical protein
MAEAEKPSENKAEPAYQGVDRSSAVEFSNVLEKGMVVDSATPIVPVAAAPTQIPQPPSASPSAAEGVTSDQ